MTKLQAPFLVICHHLTIFEVVLPKEPVPGKPGDDERVERVLDLTPADFEWATAELLRVAAVCCPGRVVSLLEGGYGTYEFSKTSATGWTISRAQLGENAAAHASALVGVSRVHH